MPVIYEDALFIVKQGWLGPWRVVSKQTGATIAPDQQLKIKVGLTWPKIRRNRELEPRFRRFAEDVLMQSFAVAAVEPRSPMAMMFVLSSPEELAAMIVEEAKERVKLISGL